MYVDAQLTFSDAQAVTATAASTNYVDTGPLFSGNLGRNLGVGDRLYIVVSCDVAMTDSSSDSTIAVTLQTDDNTSFSSATTLLTIGTFAALSAVGTALVAPLPIGAYERYIRLYYTAANGDLTTGSYTASIVKDISQWTSTAQGSPGTGY